MSHDFSVSRAIYDATAGQSNPLVQISATVDGRSVPIKVYWYEIQNAYYNGGAVTGQDAVRQVLQALLVNLAVLTASIPAEPHQEPPVFVADPALLPEPSGLDANAGWVSVPEALAAGSWTA